MCDKPLFRIRTQRSPWPFDFNTCLLDDCAAPSPRMKKLGCKPSQPPCSSKDAQHCEIERWRALAHQQVEFGLVPELPCPPTATTACIQEILRKKRCARRQRKRFLEECPSPVPMPLCAVHCPKPKPACLPVRRSNCAPACYVPSRSLRCPPPRRPKCPKPLCPPVRRQRLCPNPCDAPEPPDTNFYHRRHHALQRCRDRLRKACNATQVPAPYIPPCAPPPVMYMDCVDPCSWSDCLIEEEPPLPWRGCPQPKPRAETVTEASSVACTCVRGKPTPACRDVSCSCTNLCPPPPPKKAPCCAPCDDDDSFNAYNFEIWQNLGKADAAGQTEGVTNDAEEDESRSTSRRPPNNGVRYSERGLALLSDDPYSDNSLPLPTPSKSMAFLQDLNQNNFRNERDSSSQKLRSNSKNRANLISKASTHQRVSFQIEANNVDPYFKSESIRRNQDDEWSRTSHAVRPNPRDSSATERQSQARSVYPSDDPYAEPRVQPQPPRNGYDDNASVLRSEQTRRVQRNSNRSDDTYATVLRDQRQSQRNSFDQNPPDDQTARNSFETDAFNDPNVAGQQRHESRFPKEVNSYDPEAECLKRWKCYAHHQIERGCVPPPPPQLRCKQQPICYAHHQIERGCVPPPPPQLRCKQQPICKPKAVCQPHPCQSCPEGYMPCSKPKKKKHACLSGCRPCPDPNSKSPCSNPNNSRPMCMDYYHQKSHHNEADQYDCAPKPKPRGACCSQSPRPPPGPKTRRNVAEPEPECNCSSDSESESEICMEPVVTSKSRRDYDRDRYRDQDVNGNQSRTERRLSKDMSNCSYRRSNSCDSFPSDTRYEQQRAYRRSSDKYQTSAYCVKEKPCCVKEKPCRVKERPCCCVKEKPCCCCKVNMKSKYGCGCTWPGPCCIPGPKPPCPCHRPCCGNTLCNPCPCPCPCPVRMPKINISLKPRQSAPPPPPPPKPPMIICCEDGPPQPPPPPPMKCFPMVPDCYQYPTNPCFPCPPSNFGCYPSPMCQPGQVILQEIDGCPDEFFEKVPKDGSVNLRIPENLQHNTCIKIAMSPEIQSQCFQKAGFVNSILNSLVRTNPTNRFNC